MFPHETARRRRRAHALDLGAVKAFNQWGKRFPPNIGAALWPGNHSAVSELESRKAPKGAFFFGLKASQEVSASSSSLRWPLHCLKKSLRLPLRGSSPPKTRLRLSIWNLSTEGTSRGSAFLPGGQWGWLQFWLWDHHVLFRSRQVVGTDGKEKGIFFWESWYKQEAIH